MRPRLLLPVMITAGACFLAAGIYLGQHSLTSSDLSRALAPLKQVPIDPRASAQVLQFRIPNDSAWKKIRKELGPPEYLIAVAYAGKNLQCAPDIHLIAKVSTGKRAIALREASGYLPYGYNTDCDRVGYKFDVSDGDDIEVEASTQESDHPESQLVVLPVWNAPVKDKIVGADLSTELSILPQVLIGAGGALASAGIVLYFLRGKLRGFRATTR